MKTIIIVNHEILIEKKSIKNMYIRILPPNGQIKVTVPRLTPDFIIKAFVKSKMPQIQSAVEKQKLKYSNSYKKFISGETHELWGMPYTLQVIQSNKNKAICDNNDIIIHTKTPEDREKNEKILNELYREELNKALPKIFEHYSRKMNLTFNEFRIKNMKTRWGTCNTKDKRIWISLQLAKKPKYCLEYVVVHELTHLYEKGHNKRFYSILENYFPKWKEAKATLNKFP